MTTTHLPLSPTINRTVPLLCCYILLTACGTKYASKPQVEQPPEVPAIESPKPAEPASPVIEPTVTVTPTEAQESLPAVVALRDQASVAASANDHLRSIGLLERALRISPNDVQTFYDLAKNHLALNQPQQALQLARRGLTLNPSNAQREALTELVSRSQAQL